MLPENPAVSAPSDNFPMDCPFLQFRWRRPAGLERIVRQTMLPFMRRAGFTLVFVRLDIGSTGSTPRPNPSLKTLDGANAQAWVVFAREDCGGETSGHLVRSRARELPRLGRRLRILRPGTVSFVRISIDASKDRAKDSRCTPAAEVNQEAGLAATTI